MRKRGVIAVLAALVFMGGCQKIREMAEERVQEGLRQESARISDAMAEEVLVLPAASEAQGELRYVHFAEKSITLVTEQEQIDWPTSRDDMEMLDAWLDDAMASETKMSLVALVEPSGGRVLDRFKIMADARNLTLTKEPLLPGMKFRLAKPGGEVPAQSPLALQTVDPPPHAERLLMDLHHGRIAFLDVTGIDKRIEWVQSQYQSKTGWRPSALQLKFLLDKNDIGGDFHRVKLDLNGGVKFVYELRGPEAGASLAELAGEESDMLATVDPKKYWIYFVARPSSMAVLRRSMQLAAERGIAFGWDLIPEDEKIIMSSSAASRGTR